MGAKSTRLGDVVPVNQVEVVRHVKENLTKTYPLSAQELANEVRKKINTALADVWKAIKDNDLKNNPNYSAYNFRSKKHEDAYKETGIIPNGTPSIYNAAAVDFLIKVLREELAEDAPRED